MKKYLFTLLLLAATAAGGMSLQAYDATTESTCDCTVIYECQDGRVGTSGGWYVHCVFGSPVYPGTCYGETAVLEGCMIVNFEVFYGYCPCRVQIL